MIELSVIICTYNREKYLLSTLESLIDQSYDKTLYEIILVNNNSSDGTEQVCKTFEAQHPTINFKYCLETNQGHSFARNRGIQEVQGKIITFTDDDVKVNHDYLSNIKRFFDQHADCIALGGKIIPNYEAGEKPQWMSNFLLPIIAALNLGDKVRLFPKNKFPIGANMSFRSPVFEKTGLFNTDLGNKGDNPEAGDEKEIFERVRKEGKIYYLPTAVVHHYIPNNRVQKAYIKKQALGVGRSNMTRAKLRGGFKVFRLLLMELVKWGVTIVFSTYYLLSNKVPKSKMLLQFRYWVSRGILKKLFS